MIKPKRCQRWHVCIENKFLDIKIMYIDDKNLFYKYTKGNVYVTPTKEVVFLHRKGILGWLQRLINL